MKTFASRLRTWLAELPIPDPIEHRMASQLQVILIGLIVVVGLATIALMVSPTLAIQEKLEALQGNFFGFLVVVLPLILLRRGYFRSSALIIITVLFITPALAIFVVFDLPRSGGILIQFTLAIILSGLLVSRSAVVLVFGLSAALVAFSAWQGQSAEPHLARLSLETAINFILFNGLIALFLDQFGITLRTALKDALARETELQSEVTQRKSAEEKIKRLNEGLEQRVSERTAELSQANALLNAMLDNVPDHVFFKDSHSRFLRNSRSQALMMGLTDPAQVVGKSDFDFFPHAQRAFDEEQEIMKSGQPIVDLEEYVVWPDGRITWVSTTKVPLRNPEGQVIGIFGIARDITDRKHTEESLRKAKEQAESANKELEAFSYSVSHDLRAPLRAIDGFTRILLEDYEPKLDAEGKRLFSVVRHEAQRMGQLIDDLLNFSRLGRSEMKFVAIDMETMAGNIFNELVTPEIRDRIDFQLGELPRALGDPVLIRQVWVNLLSNAIKFSAAQTRAIIEVQCTQTENETIYQVRDNGAGFDMDYADKLFGVFQRLHNEKEFEGTGVGLAIVQRVILRHGGRVWGEGQVHQGATFYFTLPRKGATS